MKKLYLYLLIVGVAFFTSCKEELADSIPVTDAINVIENIKTVSGPNSIEIQYDLSSTEGVSYIQIISDLGTSKIDPVSGSKLYEFLDASTEYTFYLATVYENGEKSSAHEIKAAAGDFIQNVVLTPEVVTEGNSAEITFAFATTDDIDFIEVVNGLVRDTIYAPGASIVIENLEPLSYYSLELYTVYTNGEKSSNPVVVTFTTSFAAQGGGLEPLLYYNFDGNISNSGSVAEAGDLTLAAGGTANFQEGKVGKAYQFNATTPNYLSSTWGEITGSSARTITAWVKLSTTKASKPILTMGSRPGSDPNGKKFLIKINPKNQFRAEIQGTGYNFTQALVPDTWTFVAVTHDGTDFMSGTTLYVGDGTSINSETANNETVLMNTLNNSNPENLLVGAELNSGDIIGAKSSDLLDEIRVYDKALTEEELMEVMNAGPKPVLHYTFDDVLTNSGTAAASGDLSLVDGGTANFQEGKIGKAYQFDATTPNYLSSTWGEITGSSARTITAWVNISGSKSNRPFFTMGSTTGNEKGKKFVVKINPKDLFRVEILGAGYNFSQALTPGTWAFVAVTHDGTDYMTGTTLYVGDGLNLNSEVANNNTIVVNTTNNSNPENTLIGAGIAGENVIDRFSSDLLDDIRVYDFVLTQEELDALMKKGL